MQELQETKKINQTQRKVQIVKKLNLTSQDYPSYSDLKAEEEIQDYDNYEEDEEEEHPLSKKLISSEGSQQQDPFLNFVNTYSLYANDAHTTILDLDIVLEKLNEEVKKCIPQKYHSIFISSDSKDLQQFHQCLNIDTESVTQLAQQLKSLSDIKLYQCIQNVEKLNLKLQLEYNVEVKKGGLLKIIKEEK